MPMSEEAKRAISKKMMGNTHALGHNYTIGEDHKRAISKAHSGKVISEEAKRAISKANSGRVFSKEQNRANSERGIGNTHALGLIHSEETKQLLAEAITHHWANYSVGARDERVRNIGQGCQRSPTEPEWMTGFCLERHFPKEWAYNGDGKAGFVIGGKVPDFVNINGLKAVIEVFGSYHHDTDVFPNKMTPEELIAHYAKYGFKCLVLWDYECYDSEELVARVRELRTHK